MRRYYTGRHVSNVLVAFYYALVTCYAALRTRIKQSKEKMYAKLLTIVEWICKNNRAAQHF